MPKYKIADIVFSAKHLFPYVQKVCKDYLCEEEEPAETELNVTIEDVEYEKSLSKLTFPDEYFESLALYRKFLEYALFHDTIILHSSALAVDGDAFLFTAPSGTGKSTHAKLYREVFKDRVTTINDDKPVVRRVNGEFFVYGTPWDGKHRLSTNAKFKIKAICALKRGEQNCINKISKKKMLLVLLNQTLRPKKEEQVDKTLILLGELLDSVSLYELYCNISEEAVLVSYGAMSKGE